MLFFVILYFNLVITVTGFKSSDIFTISTKGCTIPTFPIVKENMQNIFQFPILKNNCSKSIALIKSNASHLWVAEDAYFHYGIQLEKESDFYCCYRNFSAQDYIESISYGSCIPFSTSTKADHEFVRVECYYEDDKMYDDFFVFASAANKLFEKTDLYVLDYNVLIFGIESLSRINFLRTMPLTANFLKEKGAVQLLGYNKLGDNSLPNLAPLLTGKSMEQFKLCNKKEYFDSSTCSFIWDEYKNAGYVTALGADSIAGLLGSYEYKINKKPTDYYLQPFMFETRNLFHNKAYNFHLCVLNKFCYKILLNYIKGVTENVSDYKLFGMFWEESVTHEHINYPHIMDKDYSKLLRNLEDIGYLDDTILIFLSDHGMRWGEFVRTEQGRLEERLPLLEVLFPQKFRDRYKLAFNNFKMNSGRLTTPFDLYHTLKDLIRPYLLEDAKILKQTQKLWTSYQNLSSSSLFLPVSESRTCSTVGISEHWCACNRAGRIPASRKTKILAAEHLISHINILLAKYPQCHNLKIKEILQVSYVRDPHGRTFRVMVETVPGGGIFDGTLRRERGVWAISGTVSRLNSYRGQTSCLRNDYIEMYCYCI